MTLNLLKTGEVAKIVSVTADEALKAKIKGLGLRIGQEVAVIRRACMGWPFTNTCRTHRHINETGTGKPNQYYQMIWLKHSFVIISSH